jgi:3-oxoacid CoA-transferase subunit B/acetate CoA/acetoacetate CoA-transferase beta subunit
MDRHDLVHPQDVEAKIVQTCQLPVTCSRCVLTIITELGVMRINQVGLVLEEVAPGVSTDDAKR